MSEITSSTREKKFIEETAAAQSMKNAWTRLASTWRMIHVEIGDSNLTIRPNSWLTDLLIKTFFFDLDHCIPLKNVLSARHEGDWVNYGKVVVSFRKDSGLKQEIRLYLKDCRHFLDVLEGENIAVSR
ncbi:MAG: hypothetical protein GXP49_00505 [Deltaproteobacteria bacterium]|nr:hypothetical protein [Deltaproteobacteria bacterium]